MNNILIVWAFVVLFALAGFWCLVSSTRIPYNFCGATLLSFALLLACALVLPHSPCWNMLHLSRVSKLSKSEEEFHEFHDQRRLRAWHEHIGCDKGPVAVYLPGYGGRRMKNLDAFSTCYTLQDGDYDAMSIESYVSCIIDKINKVRPTFLIGYSVGGLLAQIVVKEVLFRNSYCPPFVHLIACPPLSRRPPLFVQPYVLILFAMFPMLRNARTYRAHSIVKIYQHNSGIESNLHRDPIQYPHIFIHTAKREEYVQFFSQAQWHNELSHVSKRLTFRTYPCGHSSVLDRVQAAEFSSGQC